MRCLPVKPIDKGLFEQILPLLRPFWWPRDYQLQRYHGYCLAALRIAVDDIHYASRECSV